MSLIQLSRSQSNTRLAYKSSSLSAKGSIAKPETSSERLLESPRETTNSDDINEYSLPVKRCYLQPASRLGARRSILTTVDNQGVYSFDSFDKPTIEYSLRRRSSTLRKFRNIPAISCKTKDPQLINKVKASKLD